MNTNTFMVKSDVVNASRPDATDRQQSVNLLYLILGLQCLKNWRNLGIIMLRGRFRASLSSSSDESSQIFCNAPNEPWDTDIHREAVKSKTQTYTDRGENEIASENSTEAGVLNALCRLSFFFFFFLSERLKKWFSSQTEKPPWVNRSLTLDIFYVEQGRRIQFLVIILKMNWEAFSH